MQLTRRMDNIGITRIVPVLVVMMETFWVYAWLVWVSRWPAWHWDGTPLSILSCLVLAIAVQMTTYYGYGKDWSSNHVRWVVLPGSLILLALLIRWNLGGGYGLFNRAWTAYVIARSSALVTAAFWGIYLIWRGIANGRNRQVFSDVYRKFVIGLVGIILLLLLWGVAGKASDIWRANGVYIILFFSTGLLAMALANLDSLRAELAQHQEATGNFARRWMSLLIALVLGIIGISLGLASIFSTNIAGVVFGILSKLGDWLLFALEYLLWPLGYVLEGIIYLIKLLLAWLAGNAEPVKMTMPDMSELQKAAEGQPQAVIPQAIVLVLKWGFLVLVIGLVIFFLAKALVRYLEDRPEKDVEEINETLWSYNALKTDLRSVLAWLFRWLRRKKTGAVEFALPPEAALINPQADNKIYNPRELYRALLWEGKESGVIRKQSETPYEYRQKLEDHLAQGNQEIDSITEAYVSARYGEVEPEPHNLRLLNRLWRNLKQKFSNKASGG